MGERKAYEGVCMLDKVFWRVRLVSGVVENRQVGCWGFGLLGEFGWDWLNRIEDI